MTGEYIFLSYNHRDSNAVERFILRLKESGIKYFRDIESRNYGQDLSR